MAKKKDDALDILEAGPPVEEPSATTPVESETHDPEKGSSYVRFSRSVWGYDDYREFIRERGQDPDEVTFTWGWTSNPTGGFWNKLNNVRPKDPSLTGEFPKWPVVQQAAPLVINPKKITKTPRVSKWKTAVVGGDTQFGYRVVDDQTTELFHDESAIDIFHQIVALENPEQTVIVGDIGDFSQQSKFVAEPGFARTTQPTIDRMALFAAQLRADTEGKIVWIEGNHDKRLQNFVEVNAQSALGLKRGNWPDSYPVMSIPNLCRLDEYDVVYKDAYPNAHWWITDNLRAEHGTRAKANGSTADLYAKETPHVSRIFGHSHRLESISHTTWDRAGRIKSQFINTGCLCRVDGTVPSVHGSKGADGHSAVVFENWQQGLAVIRYLETGEFFTELIQIEDGKTFYQGQELSADG